MHVGFLDGPPIRNLDEIAQQPLGILLRRFGNDFDRHVADGRARECARPTDAEGCSASGTTDRWTAVRRHGLQRHTALLARAEPPHRQVAEQQLVTTRDVFILQRPRDFQPLHGVAGHALLGRQRIDVLLVGAVDARAEEPHRVGADALAARELHFDLADGRLRREVHDTDGPRLARALRVDSDGLVVAAGPDFVRVGPVPDRQPVGRRLFITLACVEPASDSAAAHPDRVALQPNAVAPGDWRVEAPAVLTGIAEDAGNLAHGLALARLRAGIGRASGAHLGLRVRVEHGKHEPVGQRAILARQIALPDRVARVDLPHRLLRPFERRRHRLAHRIVRRGQVALHLHEGYVERLAALVETIRFAVERQLVLHLRPRDVQQIAKGVFVFVAVEPALHCAAVPRRDFLLEGGERR